MSTLMEKLKALSPELQKQVEAFVDRLLAQQEKKKQETKGKRLRLDWGGGLRDLREQYDALTLQKKALEWRTDEAPIGGRKHLP